MGYFDGLTSGNFKIARDGGKLYYPWGYWGRGYAISEQDDARLRRQLKIYHAVSLVLIIATASTGHFVVMAALTAALMVFYALWSWHLTAGMQATDERLSFHASLVSQARAYGAGTLWLLEIIAILFVVSFAFMLVRDVADWPLGLFGIVFFGLCAAVGGYQLVLRRRATLNVS